MEKRVTRLEVNLEHLRMTLDTIQRQLEILPTLGTKRDLVTYSIAGLTIAIATVAIIVGGLGWLETRAGRVQPSATPAATPVTPQPIIIQLPAPERRR